MPMVDILLVMFHMYHVSGSNRAYHGANDGLKIEFEKADPKI